MPEIAVSLPAADHPNDTGGSQTAWIGHLGDQWTAFEDHIENADGEPLATKDVRDSALAMLAAVYQVELWRVERESRAAASASVCVTRSFGATTTSAVAPRSA